MRAPPDALLGVRPLDFRVGQLDVIGDRAAIAAVRRHVREHDVLQLDLEVHDELAVAIGPHEFEHGFWDCFAGRAGLEQDRRRKVGQLVEMLSMSIRLRSIPAPGFKLWRQLY